MLREEEEEREGQQAREVGQHDQQREVAKVRLRDAEPARGRGPKGCGDPVKKQPSGPLRNVLDSGR